MDDRETDKCESEDRGVSIINISPFCDKLEKFIKYIGGVRDLNFFTYEYQNDLKDRLDADVAELEIILAEVREAFVNAEKLKTQRKSIRNDKIGLKKILKRMRDDEVREMECVISLYDKPMFSRWENAKATQKPEVLDAMLTDVKGKQLALDNLTVLVTRKINQIGIFQPSNTGESNDENNAQGIRDRGVIPLPLPSFCTTIIPIPPPPPPPPMPIPIQGPVSHLPKRSYAQRLSMQRRRRLERRDDHSDRRSPIINDDLSSIPLTLTVLPDNLAINLYPAISSPGSNSSQDIVSDNNGAVTDGSNGIALLDIDGNNNNNSSNEPRGLGTEFQNEMQTVLQALFGDLRSAPTLLVAESTSGNVAEAENAANNNREIELYTLRKNE